MEQSTQQVSRPSSPPIPAVIPTSPLPPQAPAKPKNWLIISLVLFVILLSLGAAGFFAYQYMQLKHQVSQAKPTPSISPSPILDVTANWKTFSDTKNGVEFKYPQDWYAKQMTGWTLNVFLDNHDFVIPTATEFMTPIQVSLNEVMNTNTNLKSYSEKTIEEAVKRFKTNFYGQNVTETGNLTIGGLKAIQLAGTAGPGMLDGQYFKNTFIQMGNKVLIVSLNNNKNYETIYNQILSTFKFLDQPSAEGKFCGGIAANLPENQCPNGFYCKLNGNYPDAGGHCIKK